jgi:hypothetical protein
MTVREYVWELVTLDPRLAAYGYGPSVVYVNHAPDAPTAKSERFLVLRWGTQGARFGRDTTVHPRDLTVWAYDVQPDFTYIDNALARVRFLLGQSEGKRHRTGWINGITDNGGSEDLRAPEYGQQAVVRNWGFTINASEEAS